METAQLTLLALFLSHTQLDGVLLLCLMKHNANRREAANVLEKIYKEFEQRKKRTRSQQPLQLALPRNARDEPRSAK